MTALETARLLYAQYDEASDHKTVLGAAMMCASHLPALIEQAERDRRDVIAAEAREGRMCEVDAVPGPVFDRAMARAVRAEAIIQGHLESIAMHERTLDRFRDACEVAGQMALFESVMGRADD